MAITKTGINVWPSGQQVRPAQYEEDGQVASITATGLTPNTSYDVQAYVVDGGTTFVSVGTETFSTLPAGTLNVTNVSGTWGTQTAQLNFSANWATTYDTVGAAANFQILTSKDNFATSTATNANYQRTTANSGTISASLTANLPSGGGSTYYVKIQITDIYSEVLTSAVYTYTVPTQTAGTMSFNPHQQTDTQWWFPSNIVASNWTYYPKYKWMIYSTDNWSTQQRTARYNYPNNVEMFVTFRPQNYAIEMCVEDIYGNVFTTTQNYHIVVTLPTFFAGDTHQGEMYWWAYVNPNLAYNDAYVEYLSTDGQGIQDKVSLMPVSDERYEGNVALPDGDYEAYLCIDYASPSIVETSDTIQFTLENYGYLKLEDRSQLVGNELYWTAAFESYFDLVDAKVTVYDNDDDFNEIGSSTVTISGGTTSGDLIADNPIPDIPEEGKCYIVVEGEDDHGYHHYDEYWFPVE